MSRNTICTVTVDVATKTAAISGTIAIREEVIFRLYDTGNAGAGDLCLALVHRDTLLAKIAQGDMTQQAGYIEGTLDMNTDELVDFFANRANNATHDFTLAIWDITNENLLVNDLITVQNNPYDTSMADPTPVTPIGNPGDYAPAANGVTGGDSHAHVNGAGAQIDHVTLGNIGTRTHVQIDSFIADADTYYAAKAPDQGEYRFDATRLWLVCPDDGKWIQVIPRLINGSYVLMPVEGTPT